MASGSEVPSPEDVLESLRVQSCTVQYLYISLNFMKIIQRTPSLLVTPKNALTISIFKVSVESY